MKNLDWFYKGTSFWLCIIYHLNSVGIDGHHNDTCLPSDGSPAICVANRYCRERFIHHLLPCGDSKICCPIPTTPPPSTTPSSDERPRRPSNPERPKSYPQDDVNSPRTEDGSSRKPIRSYDKPVREFPDERRGENERPRFRPEFDDTEDDSRRPVVSYGKEDSGDRSPSSEEDGRSRRKSTRRPGEERIPPRSPEEERIPPRRTEEERIPPRRYEEERIPPRRAEEERIPSRRSEEERIPPRRTGEERIPSRRTEEERIPPRRTEEERIPPRRYEEEKIPPRRTEEERIPTRRTEEERIPPRRPEERGRPKQNADDLLPEDRPSRNPISAHDKPVEDIPPRRPVERERPRVIAGNAPRQDTGIGNSRRPINTQNKPDRDIPPRRPSTNERPSKPTLDDRERPRKPVDVYDEPVDGTPTRSRDEHARPVGGPRYDDHRLERPSTKPGKVRFEEDSFRERDDRPSKPYERGQPSGTEPIEMDGNYDSKSEYFPMPRRDQTASKNNRDDSDLDDYDRRRPTGDAPSRYPSEDQIEVHRDPPRSASNPTRVRSRNHSIDVPRSTHEFPEPHDFLATQPKVPECGVKPYELFIAGGEASDPHEWPWMTAIFRRHQNSRPKTFICGGSLINTKYVLTAAHCFVHNYVILPASTFVVRVGSHQLSSGEEYTVSNLVIHHNHSGSDFFNDIALMRLASEVYVTDKVAPICLPFHDMAGDNFVGRSATVAGWGDTAFRSGGARTLQHVTIPIVSSDECFAAYSRVRGAAFLARGSEHVICAGLREGGKDACLGDSGGPLMLKATEDRWIVVGIVSLGYKCAEPGYPGVYTRVTHYMSWIQNNMKRH